MQPLILSCKRIIIVVFDSVVPHDDLPSGAIRPGVDRRT
jgi:hypothetical protein